MKTQVSLFDIDLSYYKNRINKIAELPEKEWEYLLSKLKITSLSKGAHLIREGEKCSKLWYILTGAIRSYYITCAGIDITFNFSFENSFITAYHSFFQGDPSNENHVLLENSTIVYLEYSDFQALVARHAIWRDTFYYMLSKYFGKAREREEILLLDNYENRYKKLIASRPFLFQRVAQQHIASYLKMTPETLSRIKKRSQQKKM